MAVKGQTMSGSQSESHSVLLIGSTGSGKSTLGNFLLDPDHQHMLDKPSFRSARDNKPETQLVTSATRNVQVKNKGPKVDLTLIDTPGLNEGAERDLSHMLDVIKELQKQGKITACIFVVKFSAKIDAQYKSTIQYYSKLLPSLFIRNVLVVMTEFVVDDRSIRFRDKLGIDVKAIKNNVKREICELANMPYTPLLFAIDCLPIDHEETQLNLEVRDAILQYIYQLIPIDVKNLMVAKTTYIKGKDNELIAELEGEINGYSERLQEVHKECKEALREVQAKERDVVNAEKMIQQIETKLNDIDRPDTVVAASWSVEESWKLFSPPPSHGFDVSTTWKVTNKIRWTNGNCHFKDCQETEQSVNGRVQGKFMRSLVATVQLETTKSIMFADEITKLKRSLTSAEADLKDAENSRDQLQGLYKEHADTIKELQDYIKQKKKKIVEFSSDFMSINEASEKLKDLKHKKTELQ
jgi:predicted GTPase